LKALGEIYQVDAQAKEQPLNAEQRLPVSAGAGAQLRGGDFESRGVAAVELPEVFASRPHPGNFAGGLSPPNETDPFAQRPSGWTNLSVAANCPAGGKFNPHARLPR